MLPFVAVGLEAAERMEITKDKDRKIIMRCAKIYPPEKMGKIIKQAQSFFWWRNYPIAAFMKAVGIINRNEKEERKKADEHLKRAEQMAEGTQESG